ncbi:MAG: 1-(5-phosphoribosyl)-5-[(5-phosphoribosylamino)methylideneamino]imidazole-4-carboxamide isomerase [Anaerolineae bacterium]
MKPFTVYPAIDLRGGKVVRLQGGDPNRQTAYSDDPGEVALRWRSAGADWLHVVDLDAAFGAENTANRRALDAILRLGGQVQFGGGVRTLEDMAALFDLGVTRVVLGTAAVEHPALVAQALARFGPGAVAVGIDARNGRVCTRGWQADSGLEAVEFARRLAALGLRTVIHTDIARDGLGTGINVAASRELAAASGLDVIASGGVAALADVHAARAAGLGGVIIGRALYEGQVDLREALRC